MAVVWGVPVCAAGPYGVRGRPLCGCKEEKPNEWSRDVLRRGGV